MKLILASSVICLAHYTTKPPHVVVKTSKSLKMFFKFAPFPSAEMCSLVQIQNSKNSILCRAHLFPGEEKCGACECH